MAYVPTELHLTLAPANAYSLNREHAHTNKSELDEAQIRALEEHEISQG